MEWLRRMFEEREREGREESGKKATSSAAETSKQAPSASPPLPTNNKQKISRVEAASPWTQRIVGAAALLGVGIMWGAASWMSN